jgi:hypothetical protein
VQCAGPLVRLSLQQLLQCRWHTKRPQPLRSEHRSAREVRQSGARPLRRSGWRTLRSEGARRLRRRSFSGRGTRCLQSVARGAHNLRRGGPRRLQRFSSSIAQRPSDTVALRVRPWMASKIAVSPGNMTHTVLMNKKDDQLPERANRCTLSQQAAGRRVSHCALSAVQNFGHARSCATHCSCRAGTLRARTWCQRGTAGCIRGRRAVRHARSRRCSAHTPPCKWAGVLSCCVPATSTRGCLLHVA